MGLISIDYACAVYTTVGSAILIPDFGTRVRSKKKKKKYIYINYYVIIFKKKRPGGFATEKSYLSLWCLFRA